MAKPNRVLVYLRDSSIPGNLHKAAFGKCILNYFGYGPNNSGPINVTLEENKLILQKPGNTSEKRQAKVDDSFSSSFSGLLRHPSLCPSFHLTENEHSNLSEDLKNRGVDVGVAVLLTSSDNHVLLTRRSSHLRTFPGVWVPPGGHIDCDETILAAGLRELKEETGISIKNDSGHLLGLWESMYPPMLEAGQPLRQHIVTYLAVESNLTWQELLSQTQLNYEETDAALWLPVSLADKMSSGKMSADETLPENVKILFRHDNNEQEEIDIPADQLLQIKTPPPDLDPVDLERITWGTMFALQQWVAWKRNSNAKCNL